MLEKYFVHLTPVKDSKERSIILPAVSLSCFCDLKITNNKRRLSLIFISYHAELYTAFPTALLYEQKKSNKNIYYANKCFHYFLLLRSSFFPVVIFNIADAKLSVQQMFIIVTLHRSPCS